MKGSTKLLISLTVLFTSVTVGAMGQTTSFSYQGKLTDSGSVANGSYDMQFKLFDALSAGSQQGATLTVPAVQVINGIFIVSLDFGSPSFSGADRFLEIAVKVAGGGVFTSLAPRQQITSSPYTIHSLTSTTADGLSVACLNCVTSTQIQSVLGSQVTGAIPVASVPAGSGNYIQNATSLQASSNFHISGDGTAAGTLAGNIVSATTQFNIGASRILSSPGTNNTLVGVGTGPVNAGTGNTFVGAAAGGANTSGGDNSFFGNAAGIRNLSGASNAFFGSQAGQANTIGGSNAFFGFQAGFSSTIGNNNSFFGTFAGLVNTTGGNNTFAGMNAGRANNIGANNAFFGFNAGLANTTGGDNSFFGQNSGAANTTGIHNSFFGESAGAANNASFNAFFGDSAGSSNTTGSANAFFGRGAGLSNTTANDNSFFGFDAGLVTIGGQNSFFGRSAGAANTSGQQNTFLGNTAGNTNTSGNNNTIIGSGADLSTGTLFNASAIGANALVSQSNSLVLGGIAGVNGAVVDTSVGIGTTAPIARLEVNGQGGTALAITNGAIRVTGAGVGTSTAAFIHVRLPANTCGGQVYSVIDHPLTNGDPNAILIVTARGVDGTTTFPSNAPLFVYYFPAGFQPPGCPEFANRWLIVSINAPKNGDQYNVLVIKP